MQADKARVSNRHNLLARPITLASVMALVLGLAACTTTSTTTSGGRTREIPSTNEQPDLPRSARVRLELASAYFGRGQTETALDELKHALEADPNLAPAHTLMALIRASMGDERQAEQSFARSLQLDAQNADTLHNYGWFLCQRRRYAEADTQFASALAQPSYNDASRTLLIQGICLARAGSLEAAERTLSRSYEIDPGNPTTAINLAEVLYRRGEMERARFYVRRVNTQPDLVSAQTLWLAARIENRLGNAAGVRDFGNRLRDRFPQSPQALQLDRGRFDE